jgi:predicted membrane protein
MLGLISVFTGMIAPGVSGELLQAPYPLTNMRWIAYIILILIIVDFYFVSMRRWKTHKYHSLGIITLLVILAFLTVTNNVIDLKNAIPLTHLSWWWVFFGVGIGLLIYTLQSDEQGEEMGSSLFFDTVLGIMGSFTLSCLALLIIYVGSMSVIKNESKKDGVLGSIFGKEYITTQSGVKMSPAYTSIEHLVFDRKNNSLSFVWEDLTGKREYFKSIQKQTQTGQTTEKIHIPLKKDEYILEYGTSSLIINGKHQVSLRYGSISGTLLKKDSEYIAFTDDSHLYEIDANGIRTWTGERMNSISIMSHGEEYDDTMWIQGGSLYKDGQIQSGSYEKAESITLSPSGIESTILRSTPTQREIVKNNIVIHRIYDGFIPSTYKSNGVHTFYAYENSGSIRAVYDGAMIENTFSEIREVFVSRDGGAYGFFARPLGEKKYCLLTRYSGNLCGLEGYMNPRLSADGSSILYAGLKDKTWKIYRNTYAIVQDTKYTHDDISGDYAFYDITNPKTYIFIEKNTDGSYLVRKNWKIIPKTWKDVWTNVFFGYDNMVIFTAQDERGWRVVEI